MRFRKLQIAWSVSWGVVAVLLCALWVRSYWRDDGCNWYRLGHDDVFFFDSTMGRLRVQHELHAFENDGPEFFSDSKLAFTQSRGIVESPYWVFDGGGRGRLPSSASAGFGIGSNRLGWGVMLPHWFLVLTAGILAAVPWIRPHFSLRTLLIATMLVAVGLGAIVWGSR
jgi:hypothetical protein